MSSPTFERSVFDQLRRDMGGDATGTVAGVLISKFRAQADRLLAELERATVTGDGHATKLAAHDLRGCSAALGAVRLSELCGELEEGRGAPPDVHSLVASVAAELRCFTAALASYP
jgi:HPt (histidine-containing phosphotransfer) domain-containing protein